MIGSDCLKKRQPACRRAVWFAIRAGLWSIALTALIAQTPMAVRAADGGQPGAAEPAPASDGPVMLTKDLLDHWLSAMRQIGSANLDSPSPQILEEPELTSRLDATCATAGFATAEECGCTVLYVAVLMAGFDPDAQHFIDPAQVIQRRISAALTRTDTSDADVQALARDRKMLFALRKALPNGVPREHLVLVDTFFRQNLSADVNLWRQLAVGMKASETSAIGNRCTRLRALTAPAG